MMIKNSTKGGVDLSPPFSLVIINTLFVIRCFERQLIRRESSMVYPLKE